MGIIINNPTTTSGGTPSGSDTQIQFNDAGSFGGATGFTYNKTTQTTTFIPANNQIGLANTANSLTGSNAQSLVDLAQTWNTTGTPSAFRINITDTASNAASNFVDLRVGGVSRFSITKAGMISSTASSNGGLLLAGNSGIGFVEILGNSVFCTNTSGNILASINRSNTKSFATTSDGFFGFGNSILDANGSTARTCIFSDAANTISQRNGVSSQVYQLYKSFTDSSNYTRAAWRFDANGTQLTTESLGTGDANISITLTTRGTGTLRTTGKFYPATDASAAQTAAGIVAGTGAPNNANGDDGDFYFRSDGGTLTTIYQKRAGTWTGIV